MAKFNSKTPRKTTKTVNLAGGEAYKQSEKLELVSILLNSFVTDTFYEKESKTNDRIIDLLGKVDPLFAAKAAIYARNEFAMRSVTHILAAELAKHISGEEWGKRFFEKVVRRPDDMSEILSYYFNKNNKSLSKAMQRGFADAFGKFDAYQLAKYKLENRKISLVDIANLTHPSPTEKNGKVKVDLKDYVEVFEAKIKTLSRNPKKNSAKIKEINEKLESIKRENKEKISISSLEALMVGLLKNTETWESALSEAGQKGGTKEEKDQLKADAWKSLIETKKIGYFALLRNLRNIVEQAPDLTKKACEILVDEKMIKSSLVLPFRFTTAMDEIEKLAPSKEVRQVMQALNTAVDISLNNVPKFDGDTLVVLDASGSMGGRPAQIGSLFAAILAKSNDADFMIFSDSASYKNLNLADSTMTLAKSVRFACGGTNFHSIFRTANKAYSRIVILSDMQGWIGYNCPKTDFESYKRRYNCDPFIYSFDLAHHGTMQFPESKVCALAGFHEKIFDIMKLVEQDKNALIKTIEETVEI